MECALIFKAFNNNDSGCFLLIFTYFCCVKRSTGKFYYFAFAANVAKIMRTKRRSMQRVLVVEDSKVVQQVLRHLTAQYLDVAVDFAWSLAECKAYVESVYLATSPLGASGSVKSTSARE